MSGHAMARQWWWSIAVVAMLPGCSAATPTPSTSTSAVPLPSPTAIVTLPPTPRPTSTPTPEAFLSHPSDQRVQPEISPYAPRFPVKEPAAQLSSSCSPMRDPNAVRCAVPLRCGFLIMEANLSRWRYSINSGASIRPSRIQEFGLLPLANPGQPGEAGIRGQAGLEIAWSDSMCALSAPITQSRNYCAHRKPEPTPADLRFRDRGMRETRRHRYSVRGR